MFNVFLYAFAGFGVYSLIESTYDLIKEVRAHVRLKNEKSLSTINTEKPH